MKSISQCLVGRVVGPSSGSSWLYYYKPGTTTKQSTLFQVLVLSRVTLEIFFLGFGLTVTEINIKKLGTETRLKVKVNLQSRIPTSFYIKLM